jgi:hypothetical protein
VCRGTAMKSREYPQARGLVGCVSLSRKELSLFRRLIEGRRSLPVHRTEDWVCYECLFASPDLGVMVRHIVRVHGAAPVTKEDLEEDDPDSLVRSARQATGS